MRLLPVVVFSFSLVLAICMGGTVRAEDEKSPQVAAAMADALESLKREVVTVHLTPDLTVQDLLDHVGGSDEFAQMLHTAEQLGGARWLGDHAVQVRLSIEGNRVGRTLLKIAQQHPDKSPIAVDVLERELQQLSDRTFSATGTSTGAEINKQPTTAPATLVPEQAPPWAVQQIETEETSSDEGARLRTARHAEALALEKLRHQVDGLPLSGGMTLGVAAQQDPRIERSIVRALGRARPFKVDYGPKGSVTVHVAFRFSDLWAELSGQQ